MVEGTNIMTSFDQINSAYLDPPEPSTCAPNAHTLDWHSKRFSEADTAVVFVGCDDCDAQAYLDITDDSSEWIWEEV